ncbi:MAG: hypothetical protein ACOZNI_15465 [Myxococcota bacterium]
MLFLLLSGCIFDNAFEGTWLFMFDLVESRSGDCAGTDTGGGEWEYEGTSNALVEIYATGDGGLAVDMGSVALVGEGKGGELTATWQYSATGDDESYETKVEMDGTLKANELTGELSETESEVDGNDTYTCSTSRGYRAVRSTTTGEEIAGD